jgi:hypothetical protein
MQWRLDPATIRVGTCNDMASGVPGAVPAGVTVSLLGLQPSSTIDVHYDGSAATRRFDVPTNPTTLRTKALRAAVLTTDSGGVRVCQ